MRYAVIENNKVINVAVATPEYAATQGWIELPEGVGIGWSFDGNTPLPPPRDIESEWAEVRQKRDQLLIESDIHVMPDRWMVMQEEEKLAWGAYREALRNIPQNFNDPADVVWPTKPE